MARPRDELTAGEWAVLAILAEGPSHGFAVARALRPDGEVGRIWTVRRPLVYRAVETLTGLGFVKHAGTVASPSGPPRAILQATPKGKRAVTRWLKTPVEHVRDARSLLMLKLLFLDRRGGDPASLLAAQRDRFAALTDGLSGAVDKADGFDRVLALWRLETASAALRLVDAML